MVRPSKFGSCQEQGNEQRSVVKGSSYVPIVELKGLDDCAIKQSYGRSAQLVLSSQQRAEAQGPRVIFLPSPTIEFALQLVLSRYHPEL